jgi:WD40 repeat protein
MRRYLFVWIIAPVLLSALSSLGQTRLEQFSTSVLGPVPSAVSMILTPDKRHVAYVAPNGDKKQLFVDGKSCGPEFEGVFLENSFVVSSNGLRIAYTIAKEDTNNPCNTCGPQGKWRAVIDGQAGPEYDRVTSIAFSPDGSRVAYGAIAKERDPNQPQSRDEWVLVVNGKETPLPYDALSHKSPVFTADDRLVYVAKKGERAVVVVDGKEQTFYEKIAQPIPIFSADGKQIAYTARNYGEDEVVVWNGQPGPGFENIPAASLVFSRDGRLAYGAQHLNEKWSVVVDGKPGAEYDQVDNIVFSPDGKHFAYNAQRGDKWLLVVDANEVLEAEQLTKGFAVFSPDSQRIAHGVKQNGKWKTVAFALEHDKAESERGSVTRRDIAATSPPDISKRASEAQAAAAHGAAPQNLGDEYDGGAGLVTFSPDGQRIAFVAWHGGKRTVVLDGKNGPEFDAITKPSFSPDGRRIVYEAARLYPDGSQKDTWFVVVDGQPKPEYDGLIRGSVAFSADGNHVVYGACQGDQRLVLIDDQISPGYRAVCNIRPHQENGFELLVVGSDLRRVFWKPQMQ